MKTLPLALLALTLIPLTACQNAQPPVETRINKNDKEGENPLNLIKDEKQGPTQTQKPQEETLKDHLLRLLDETYLKQDASKAPEKDSRKNLVVQVLEKRKNLKVSKPSENQQASNPDNIPANFMGIYLTPLDQKLQDAGTDTIVTLSWKELLQDTANDLSTVTDSTRIETILRKITLLIKWDHQRLTSQDPAEVFKSIEDTRREQIQNAKHDQNLTLETKNQTLKIKVSQMVKEDKDFVETELQKTIPVNQQIKNIELIDETDTNDRASITFLLSSTSSPEKNMILVEKGMTSHMLLKKLLYAIGLTRDDSIIYDPQKDEYTRQKGENFLNDGTKKLSQHQIELLEKLATIPANT